MLTQITGNYSDDRGNEIIAPEGLKNVQVEFLGSNNKLIIDPKSQIHHAQIFFPANGAVCIVNQTSYTGRIRVGNNCLVSVGNKVTCTGAAFIYTAENTAVILGDDIMLASQIQIRSEDSHAIYDVESGNRLNISKNIVIGEHVWISESTTVLSGSRIGSGSVVGTKSVIKGSHPNNSLIVGVPCRVVKKNIAWERPNIAFNEPYVRHNAIEQGLVVTPHAWRKTDEDDTNISLGASYSKFLELNVDLSRYGDLKIRK